MDWTTLYIICILLILPIFIYSLASQVKVNETFDKYSTFFSKRNITASELTKKLLTHNGITNVSVSPINGKLTDCYDSKNKVIKLSSSTYNSTSIASLGVCAHEVGHAVQDHKGNLMFKLRHAIIPVVNFISRAYIPLIIIGTLLDASSMVLGFGYYIVLVSTISYGASMLVYFVTLPLEYDASKRALKMLDELNVMDEEELRCTKQVLTAAIHTYVAALLTSMLYFLRFLSLLMMIRNDKK